MRKKINLYRIVIVIYLLLETRFFYLFTIGSLENFITYKNKMLISFFIVSISMVLILIRKKVSKSSVNKWCLLFLIYVLFETIRNGIMYNLDASKMFLACHAYLLIIFCFFIHSCEKKEEIYKFIIKAITIFSIITSILFIMQIFLYSNFKISFLKIIEYPQLSMAEKREFGIRLTFHSTLIIFSFLISCGQLKENKRNKLHKCNLIFGAVYIFYICQTRMTSLAIVCSIAIIMIFNRISGGLKKFIIVTLTIIVLIAPLGLENLFDNKTGSVYARIYSINLYTREFLENPVFGIGLLPDDGSSATIQKILHGEKGYANITDIGIIGYIVQFGIVGIALLIYLIKLVYGILKGYKKRDAKYYSLITSIIYILITSSTLSIFDTQRIVILPFILFFVFDMECSNKTELEHSNRLLEEG